MRIVHVQSIGTRCVSEEMHALKLMSYACLRAAQREHLHQVVHHIAAFDQLEPGRWNMFLRLPVEARANRPGNPGLPEARDESPYRPARPHIFEQADRAARPDDAAQLPVPETTAPGR